jgi:hypothetical protein
LWGGESTLHISDVVAPPLQPHPVSDTRMRCATRTTSRLKILTNCPPRRNSSSQRRRSPPHRRRSTTDTRGRFPLLLAPRASLTTCSQTLPTLPRAPSPTPTRNHIATHPCSSPSLPSTPNTPNKRATPAATARIRRPAPRKPLSRTHNKARQRRVGASSAGTSRATVLSVCRACVRAVACTCRASCSTLRRCGSALPGPFSTLNP